MQPKNAATSDERHFRTVLGQLPTGVAVIAAIGPDGRPCGMAVGSFGSVSLDPPLVSYMPALTSSSYKLIAEAPNFCVSILGADQDDICRTMAVSGGDKFQEIAWTPAPSGAPIIDGSLAWIDCTPVETCEAGDHYIVLGHVDQLGQLTPGPPLVFFRGGYGAVTTSSLVAPPDRDLIEPLRLAGLARRSMEELAHDLGVECQAIGVVGGETVALAIANAPGAQFTTARVGYRAPLTSPVGSVFVAWTPNEVERWLGDTCSRATAVAALERVKQRRWSVVLGDGSYDELERAVGHQHLDNTHEDEVRRAIGALDDQCFDPEVEANKCYDVRVLTAPVFDAHGVALALQVRGFSTQLSGAEIVGVANRLNAAADRVSRRIRGSEPTSTSAPTRA
ncbi:flavin reductase [Rhodococcus sp. NPDC056960]|uniref:flavin reductase n=1 Tax=Rhodococcus TaxID=1827 RepID=UPI00362C3063